MVRKGARKAKIPLTPATAAALEAYLADRAQRIGVPDWRQLAGPLLAWPLANCSLLSLEPDPGISSMPGGTIWR